MKKNKSLAVSLGLILIFIVTICIHPISVFAADNIPITSYDAFRNAVIGKAFDVDGSPTDQPYQCYDGAAILWKQLGRSLNTGGNDAKGTWLNARDENAGNDFHLITNINDVKRGDVVVFDYNATNFNATYYDDAGNLRKPGHIAYADNDYAATHTLNIFGQNQLGKPYFTVQQNVSVDSFLGAFRLKTWEMPPNGVLDVNGTLDGTYIWSLDGYVTFDVYINGSLQKDDVPDYCADLPSGTRYEISDIKAKDGYANVGVQGAALSGTIGSGETTVELKLVSCRLDVNGMLDGRFSGGIENYGTFDVYIGGVGFGGLVIGGEKVADDVNDYFSLVKKGTNYRITDIKATDGYKYEGVVKGSLTGTVGAETKEVVLDFYTLGIPIGDWTYCDVLPRNITSDYCDIEYNNIYEKIAESSPGSGWTNEGAVREEWVNVGGVYVRNTDLETSDARILVSSNYYHFCGPNAGDVGNYEQTGNYVHYDSIDASRVTATYLGDDNGYPYYFVYLDGNQLWCQSGVTCDGAYGTHGRRCRAWYKENRYQDRRKVTYYKFRKESGWTTSKDTSATTVKYRYRLKDTQTPVISSVKVTKITPDGYTIVCKASDDTGVVKLAASSWTDTETEAAVKVNEAVPDIVSGEVEITVTIPISEHSNEKDVNYNTKVTVYDKVGKATEYTEKDIKVYIPMLVRSPKKLDLPKVLNEIEDEAFEGSIGFGEVIIPNGTVKIGSKAFANCSRLVFISIPESVTEIADDALDGCGNAVILCGIDSKAAEFAVKNGIPYITSIFDE